VKTDRLEEEHYVRRERSFKESNAKLQHSMVQNSTKLCKTLQKSCQTLCTIVFFSSPVLRSFADGCEMVFCFHCSRMTTAKERS